MNLPRPLTRTLLKKMVLKTYAAIEEPNSEVFRHTSSYRGVIDRSLSELFGTFDLTDQESEDAFRAVSELVRDGYLVQNPQVLNDGVLKLTKEGKELAGKSLEDITLVSINLQDLLSHSDLREKVRDDFYAGEFESAVMKAYKMVEEAVRTKSGLSAAEYGADLIVKAFKSPGHLKHPGAKTPAEAESLFFLMRGAFGWFRNPANHRTVDYSDAHGAAHVLAFANLLLDAIDRCTV
jgi:uncharacterized protein (TIGR02391 family)